MGFPTGSYVDNFQGEIKIITCLTLSPTPHSIITPRSVFYFNFNSEFDDAAGMYASRIAAIFKIKTPYFFYQDIDDPLPTMYPIPSGGMVYGNYHTTDAVTLQKIVVPAKQWSKHWFMENHGLIRKGIYNTAKARAIASLLPKGEYHAETLLHYFLCAIYGGELMTGLEMLWRKRPSGMHTKTQAAIDNSIAWIKENESKVFSILKP